MGPIHLVWGHVLVSLESVHILVSSSIGMYVNMTRDWLISKGKASLGLRIIVLREGTKGIAFAIRELRGNSRIEIRIVI